MTEQQMTVPEALDVLRSNIRDEDGNVLRAGIRDNDRTRRAMATILAPAALSHAEGEASGPDYLMDALDNLVHDNYERGYRGAQNRQEDAELIRCALRRSHPAPQVAVPEDRK